MARTSKAMAALDDSEAALKREHSTLMAQLAGIEKGLELVADMRRRLSALPKRTSRAKRTQAVLAASVAGDSKATAS